MCGLIGIASRNPVLNWNFLKSGRDTMAHRGPDDAGSWWSEDRRVGLGHRRLSIIDLTPGGKQPMVDKSGMLNIVFNGEIYNYKDLKVELAPKGSSFFSNSDTEVILEAYRVWGFNMLEHLNGMFAFALYDKSNQTILLARDRVGEKPLFYHFEGGTLRFASELKAFMLDPSIPCSINQESLDCFLHMGYVPGERCILKDFKKLPPANALKFNLKSGKIETWRYWQIPELTSNNDTEIVDENALLDELEVLLQDAVSRQLVADVPVGLLLSGGVDSSLVTAMAARMSNKVNTFTIRFPGHGKFDETEHASMIARHFRTEHTELEAQPSTAEILPSLAKQFDEPIIDSSLIPTYLVSQLIRSHCTVALGGDGGDELFGGYTHYSRLLQMKKYLRFIPPPILHAISLGAEYSLPLGLKGRNWLQNFKVDLKYDLPLIVTHFDSNSRRKLCDYYKPKFPLAENIVKDCSPKQSDLLQRATRMDFQNYLPEDILVKVDRASMLNSLEIRSPFLDYRLIEFAFGKVHSYLKATTNNKKIILKQLTSRILPADFDRQRKQGFSIPLSSWLKGGTFRELFHDILLDKNCLFNYAMVKRLLNNQDRGLNNSERLFGLVIFELWRREYKISL